MLSGRSTETPATSLRRGAKTRPFRFVLFALAAATVGSTLSAQVGSIATAAPVLSPVGLWRSATSSTTPSALANTLTVRINSGAAQTIPAIVDNVINTFPTPVSITTEWQLATAISVVDLVGYFASPSAALSTTGTSLPSSRVLGRMTSGVAVTWASFTNGAVAGVGTAGASLHLFRQAIILPVNGIGQRTDNLELQLDLRGQPKLPAGSYRGTLTLRAVAY